MILLVLVEGSWSEILTLSQEMMCWKEQTCSATADLSSNPSLRISNPIIDLNILYSGNRSIPIFKHRLTKLHSQEWDSFKLENLYNPDCEIFHVIEASKIVAWLMRQLTLT